MSRPKFHCQYESGDVLSLAVRYMEAIAKAHAFEQGNKRTGFDAGFVFLMSNGYDLMPEADNELTAVAFLELIEKTRTAAEFEDYLADFIVPL